ncbi:MAG: pantetheine-phosphate adenylyltransferase, partial [Clostridia bacterium]|nr:pantetheine-phosphate adenylyltransferase [Clostridia bacterium]
MNIGFYAGSFDPFTFGHLHVIKKSSAIFDKVVVGIGFNLNKKRRFDKERMKLAMEKCFNNLGLKNVQVVCYMNMTIDTAKKYNANMLIRGIRNGMDYAYEENIAQINEQLTGIDTMYLRAGKYGIVSSSMVYELLQNHQDITNFVPSEIIEEFNLQKQTIVFASQNKHKIEEVKSILPMYNILSLKDIGFNQDIIEDGDTFKDNAL